MARILLIVPCYNEETRLPQSEFLKWKNEIDFLFANDGSKDGTTELLNAMAAEHPTIKAYHAPENVGKGNVIWQAYQSLGENARKYEWIGYWDADLATPLLAVGQMLKYREMYTTDVDAIWGSRVLRMGSRIVRKPLRHFLGRAFVTTVSNLLGVKAYDSQCGAKLFKSDAAEIAFQEPFISRWIFDVEILLRLQNHKIIEFPLMEWEDVPGSKMRIFREFLRVGRDILKIKKAYDPANRKTPVAFQRT